MDIKTAIKTVASIVLIIAFIYAVFFTIATINYAVFYRKMVAEQIVEMVKSESLKGNGGSK